MNQARDSRRDNTCGPISNHARNSDNRLQRRRIANPGLVPSVDLKLIRGDRACQGSNCSRVARWSIRDEQWNRSLSNSISHKLESHFVRIERDDTLDVVNLGVCTAEIKRVGTTLHAELNHGVEWLRQAREANDLESQVCLIDQGRCQIAREVTFL